MNDYINEMLKDIYTPNIEGFNEIGTITDESLKECLQKLVPLNHMNECPVIKYDPEDIEFLKNSNVLAYYNTKTHEIKISGINRFNDSPYKLIGTTFHEIAHNVYHYNVNPNYDLKEEWNKINENSYDLYTKTDLGFVSNYAITDTEEDFCESYKEYIRNPELLKVHSIEKYEFMRNKIFKGIEYDGKGNILNEDITLITKEVSNSNSKVVYNGNSRIAFSGGLGICNMRCISNSCHGIGTHSGTIGLTGREHYQALD